MNSDSEDTPIQNQSAPVLDSVPRANDELAVGAALEFQKKWWMFERSVWVFFGVVIAISASGLLGRGPLARAHAQSANGAISVDYEFIQHIGTPSRIKVRLSPVPTTPGHVTLWLDNSWIHEAGLQSVVPTPETSVVGTTGTIMVFNISALPVVSALKIQPDKIGLQRLQMRTDGAAAVTVNLVVLP